MVLAFSGWNDAGSAASSAAEYLDQSWSAAPFATIDAEEFFDFTAMRPTIEIVDGLERQLHWPQNTFHAAHLVDAPFDAVLLLGMENLKRRDRTPQDPGYYVEFKKNRLIRHIFGAEGLPYIGRVRART